MRPISEWTEADLQALVDNKTPESLNLEYKASPALDKADKKRDEMCKDVSALANSAGGVIVYGIEADPDTGIPTQIDGGSDPSVITADWIDQILTSRIQRRIDGVVIHAIPLSAGPGRVAYVISVPQSQRAPHQSPDRKFYKRSNGRAEAMEEYEIRDVSRRALAPDLRAYFRIGTLHSGHGPLTIAIENLSDTPCLHAVARVFVDARMPISGPGDFQEQGTRSLPNQDLMVLRLVAGYGQHAELPLFKGEKLEPAVAPIQLSMAQIPRGEYFLGWSLSAPNMGRRSGYARFTRDLDGFIHTLSHPDEGGSLEIRGRHYPWNASFLDDA